MAGGIPTCRSGFARRDVQGGFMGITVRSSMRRPVEGAMPKPDEVGRRHADTVMTWRRFA